MHVFSRFGLALVTTGLLLATGRADEADVRKAVTFYASFDETVKGDVGGGDLNIGTRSPHPTEKGQFVFEKGIDATVLKIAKGKGVVGGAFEATDVVPKNGWMYFPVKGNLAFKKGGWSGSLSLWCNTDPTRLIKAKFCDPVQITQKGYDNGALWFDFNDAKPRDLRFGAFTTRLRIRRRSASPTRRRHWSALRAWPGRRASGITLCSRSRTSTRVNRTPSPPYTSTGS
jgi:hypothetical protein